MILKNVGIYYRTVTCRVILRHTVAKIKKICCAQGEQSVRITKQ